MEDRFKFRVWYKPEYNKPIMFYDAEKTYDFMRGEPGTIPAECFGELLEYDKEFTVMQCTGLKDKNGTLIYEGDILRSEEYPFMCRDIYNYSAEVLWDDKSASFYYYTFKNKNSDVNGVSTGNTGGLAEYQWEIIGNIYKNPELLESEE